MRVMLSFTQSGVRSWAIWVWYMRTAWIRSTSSLEGITTGLLSSFMALIMSLRTWYFSVSWKLGSWSAVLGVVAGSCFCSWSCFSQSIK